MAKARAKISREELKQDELVHAFEEWSQWFKRHRGTILSVGGLAIVLIVLAVFYRSYKQGIVQETSQTLYEANILLAQLPNVQNEEDRMNRLQDTVQDLQDLIERYADSKAARAALYLQGNCYFYMDKLEEATAAYDRFIEVADTNEDKARGEIALGFTLENKFYLQDEDPGRLTEAYAHYELAQQQVEEESYLHVYARMNQARVLELTSQDERALEIYNDILERRPAPRIANRGADQPADPTGQGFGEMIQAMIRRSLEPLSFHATARLRADRIQAKYDLVGPVTEGATLPKTSPPGGS